MSPPFSFDTFILRSSRLFRFQLRIRHDETPKSFTLILFTNTTFYRLYLTYVPFLPYNFTSTFSEHITFSNTLCVHYYIHSLYCLLLVRHIRIAAIERCFFDLFRRFISSTSISPTSTFCIPTYDSILFLDVEDDEMI